MGKAAILGTVEKILQMIESRLFIQSGQEVRFKHVRIMYQTSSNDKTKVDHDNLLGPLAQWIKVTSTHRTKLEPVHMVVSDLSFGD